MYYWTAVPLTKPTALVTPKFISLKMLPLSICLLREQGVVLPSDVLSVPAVAILGTKSKNPTEPKKKPFNLHSE